MNAITEAAVTIGVLIVGVATLAVLVSKNAQTPQVLQSAGSAFSAALGAATAPVTGGGLGSFGSGFSNQLPTGF